MFIANIQSQFIKQIKTYLLLLKKEKEKKEKKNILTGLIVLSPILLAKLSRPRMVATTGPHHTSSDPEVGLIATFFFHLLAYFQLKTNIKEYKSDA